MVSIEGQSSEEVEMEDAQDDDTQTLGSPRSLEVKMPPDIWTLERHCKELQWLASADLEARKAYGRALTSSHSVFSSFHRRKPLVKFLHRP